MRTVLLAFVAAGAGCAEPELRSTEQASHSWANHHWARTTASFTLRVGDNVTSAWDVYLDTTIGDWSRSQVLELSETAGAASGRRCTATSGRVEVCNATYGRTRWLGVATIWLSGSHITAGTAKLNDTYFNTARYNTPAWRNFVMCQEVGHTLGLDHQDEDFDNEPLGSCLDYSDDPAPNQHPNTHDYDQLEAIYEHLDGTTTIDQLSEPADGNAPLADWGALVASTRDGRHETYVRDLGNDRSLVTFVTWASE